MFCFSFVCSVGDSSKSCCVCLNNFMINFCFSLSATLTHLIPQILQFDVFSHRFHMFSLSNHLDVVYKYGQEKLRFSTDVKTLPRWYLHNFVANVILPILFTKTFLPKSNRKNIAQEEHLVLRLRPNFSVSDWVKIVSILVGILSPCNLSNLGASDICTCVCGRYRVVGFSAILESMDIVSRNLADAM